MEPDVAVVPMGAMVVMAAGLLGVRWMTAGWHRIGIGEIATDKTRIMVLEGQPGMMVVPDTAA
jgi:hypothetical protein